MQRESDRPSRAPASLPDLYPLRVLRAEPAGRVFQRELAPGEAMYVQKAYSIVLSWCRWIVNPAREFAAAPAAVLRTDLAAPPLPIELRNALTVLCSDLVRTRRDPHQIALACVEVSDCAVARGARNTALLWTEAAALSVPLNPRFAWLVGKLHRKWGNCRDAEHWLRQSFRVAVRIDDRDAQALALNSLGNLYQQTGNYKLSKEFLDRALQRARRHRLRSLEAEILHDLSLLSTAMDRLRDAERYGALAFEKYGEDHQHLPKLAHDLAQIWISQGFFDRALGVYAALLARFQEPEDRLRVLAALIRCAGATGEYELFDQYWDEAWLIAHGAIPESVLATTLADMGHGAASISEWTRATQALEWAMRTAEKARESDAFSRAEAALDAVRNHQRIDGAPRHVRENPTSERLAEDLKQRLQGVRG